MQWRFNKYRLGGCGAGVMLFLSACSSDITASNTTSPQPDKIINYRPSSSKPQAVGDRLVGPALYTVDSRSKELWMYFDFSQNSVIGVQNHKTEDWDIAFQRHAIRSNGGDTNPAGQAAIAALKDQTFDSVTEVPPNAEFVSDVLTKKRLHAYNPEIHKWYNYNYTNNVLSPKPITYVVRTQDSKYAKIRVVSYYCHDDKAGCMTFEYVYQGNGSRAFSVPSTRVSQYARPSDQSKGHLITHSLPPALLEQN